MPVNSRICVYPGSFDPITLGHMDIIERAARLYDRVVVAVLRNPDKRGCFPVAQRLDMIRRSCAHLPNVTADSFEGLTVAFTKAQGAAVMIRGLRAMVDFEGERALAQINQHICPEVETVCLIGRPEHSAISSSGVREMASYGCSIRGYVPACIEEEIQRHFSPA